MQSKQIDYRFKILYCLGIILVVAGHCDNGGVSILYDWFPPYAFQLGLFMFCSGYFYKDESEQSVGKYITRKIKHLIIPLYLWNIAYGVLSYILSTHYFTIGGALSWQKFVITPILTGHQFGYNLGGWYVIPLFMIEVLNVLLRFIFDKLLPGMDKRFLEIGFFIFYFAMGLVSMLMYKHALVTGWWLVLDRMLYFMPFFGLGCIYKRVLEKYDRLPSLWYFSIIFLVSLIIIVINGSPMQFGPAMFSIDAFPDVIYLPFLVGFLGIAFWLRMARIMEPAIGHSGVVNKIADSAFPIMIHQLMGFFILNTVFAVLFKLTGLCPGFDIDMYHSNIYYIYCYNDIEQLRILYLIMGISIPILIQTVQDNAKRKMAFMRKKHG